MGPKPIEHSNDNRFNCDHFGLVNGWKFQIFNVKETKDFCRNVKTTRDKCSYLNGCVSVTQFETCVDSIQQINAIEEHNVG